MRLITKKENFEKLSKINDTKHIKELYMLFDRMTYQPEIISINQNSVIVVYTFAKNNIETEIRVIINKKEYNIIITKIDEATHKIVEDKNEIYTRKRIEKETYISYLKHLDEDLIHWVEIYANY